MVYLQQGVPHALVTCGFLLLLRERVKKHGLVRVLSGVDKLGVQHDEPCFTRDANELTTASFLLCAAQTAP